MQHGNTVLKLESPYPQVPLLRENTYWLYRAYLSPFPKPPWADESYPSPKGEGMQRRHVTMFTCFRALQIIFLS